MTTTTTTTKRPTKAQNFAELRTLVPSDRADLLSFIDHEIEMLSKRTTDRKPTAKERENASLREHMIGLLTTHPDGMTIADFLADDVFNGMSNQRVSALLAGLVSDKAVERFMVKRKAHFKLPQ